MWAKCLKTLSHEPIFLTIIWHKILKKVHLIHHARLFKDITSFYLMFLFSKFHTVKNILCMIACMKVGHIALESNTNYNCSKLRSRNFKSIFPRYQWIKFPTFYSVLRSFNDITLISPNKTPRITCCMPTTWIVGTRDEWYCTHPDITFYRELKVKTRISNYWIRCLVELVGSVEIWDRTIWLHKLCSYWSCT